MRKVYSNCCYNTDLQLFANELRKSMTKAEACLWKYVLRAGGMKGYTFRRQRPVLRYIADFLCKELRLIIEVDGGIHEEACVMEKDLLRQQELEAAGFTVLRFRNEEVLTGIAGVRTAIEDWIDGREQARG